MIERARKDIAEVDQAAGLDGQTYHDVLCALYDGVLISSLNGTIIDMNARALSLLGYGGDELRNMGVTQVLPGLSADILARISTHVEHGRPTVLSGQCMCKDESTFKAEISVGGLGSAGRLMFAIRRTERGLRAKTIGDGHTQVQAASQRQILNGLYEAVLIADANGWIVEANNRALESLGYTDSEIREMTVPQLLSGMGRTVLAKIREHIEEGRFSVLDVPCVRKDGSRFLAETAVGRMPADSDAQFVFSLRNIDQRRATREQIRHEHTALQHIAIPIAVINADGVLVYVNPSLLRLWGWPSETDLLEKNVEILFHDCRSFTQLLSRLRVSASWKGEVSAKGRNGQPFPVRVTATPHVEAQGQVSGIVLTCEACEDSVAAITTVSRGNPHPSRSALRIAQ